MKQIMLGFALLFSSVAAWSGQPCCSVAEPVGIKGLTVGAQVDLVGGQLRTATGMVIRGQVQP